MRNNRNNETMSIDQSNESWGAITPRDPLVAPRTLKDHHQIEYFHSPDGRSLIIDESMRHENVAQKASQGTDGEYSRSNLYENSEGQDPQTIGRNRRIGKKIKKAKKRRENNKNNSLAKISGNLPRDFELEQAFSNYAEDCNNNHINLNHEEIGENLESSPEYNGVNEMEFKKLKYENRELRSQLARISNQYELANEVLEKKKNEAHDLASKLFEEEKTSRELSDKLNLLNDVSKGVNKAKIKDLTNEKLKRSRQENKQLKEENRDLEQRADEYHQKLLEKEGMEDYYMNEISKLESTLERYKIKDSIISKNKEEISALIAQIQQLKKSQGQIIQDANASLEDMDNNLNSYKAQLNAKDVEINRLQKQLQDNAHLVENDEEGFRRHMAEVEALKVQLKEVTDELEEYKKYGEVSSKIDIDKEIQKKVQIYNSKLQSAHQQIDEWKHKAKQTEQKVESLQKQIKILESKAANQDSNANSGDDEAILKFKELFDIPEEADVLEEIERVREEVEMVNLLKEELEKAQKIHQNLEEKHKKLLSKKSNSDMNEYTQELLNAKNEEIDRLTADLNALAKKFDDLETLRIETSHENHELTSRLNEYDHQLKARQKDILFLQKTKEELEGQNYEIKEAAKEMLKSKKELERQLKEAQSLDDLQKSKSQKDVEHLRKESNELISFILALEMAKDEEFEKLFKNESYKDEFDQAKKHLQNQSDIVGSLLDRLQKDNLKMTQEVEEYRKYVQEMEDKIEDIEQIKKDSDKWKQSYERLAVTLKNSKNDETKDMESILTDYESIQTNLADLKLECTTKGKIIKDKESIIDRLNILIKEDQKKISELENKLKDLPEPTAANEINTQNTTLLLKLEKDNKKLESELSSLRSEYALQKESHQSLTQKHTSTLEKLLPLEKAHKTLEIENQSLCAQITQLQEEFSEAKALLKNSPQDQTQTVNSLKSTISKKESDIKGLKAEIKVLQNLLDEARMEFNRPENSTQEMSFQDALEMLDSIISKQLAVSSSHKGQEFQAVLKRAQLIKDQTEECIIQIVIVELGEHLPADFEEKRAGCKTLGEQKQLIAEFLANLKESYNTNLDSSTDSKAMRKPYGYQTSSANIFNYIHCAGILSQFVEVLREEHERKSLEAKQQMEGHHRQEMDRLRERLVDEVYKEKQMEIEDITLKHAQDLKQQQAKLAEEFEESRRKMGEQFDSLKKEFKEQFSQQSRKYQEVSEEEINRQRQELEMQREQMEKEYDEKLQKKTASLEGMFKVRNNELEDEFALKKQKLEFEFKSKTESQDTKNKAELESLIQKFEDQAAEKIKRIEAEASSAFKEYEESMAAKSEEIKKLKQEHEKKMKEYKKVMQRETKFKSETLEKEAQQKVDRESKKHKEVVEELEEKVRQANLKINEEKKKHRELQKSTIEKHKSEIRNLKNTHENELKRRQIEHDSALKKLTQKHELALEDLQIQHQSQLSEALSAQKKELATAHSQKLKLQLTNHEKLLLDRETELNKMFAEKEAELLKKHLLEMDELDKEVKQKYNEITKNAVEKATKEAEDRHRQIVDGEIESVREMVREEYRTENYQLKLKLKEINDSQSMPSARG